MTDPRIPTEDDFLATPDVQKAFEEPLAKDWPDVVDEAPKISSPRDFVDEAVADGLVKDGDTRSVFERTYVPVSQRPDKAKAWVDDAIQALRLMAFSAEIDGWEYRNEARLDKLYQNFPDEHERLCGEIWAARENVKQLRW